jgi:hypothetical protein
MVIGTTRVCHFCGQVHFVGDAWGPEWCEKDGEASPDGVLSVLGGDPLDGFSNLEGKPVSPPIVGIHELFGRKKPK